MVKILSYSNTGNLGDAIQTIAMIEYLKSVGITQYSYVDRKNIDSDTIVNGWHRNSNEFLPKNAIFISLHTDIKHLQTIDHNILIGCRDYWTLDNCKKLNKKAILTGCVTINLPALNNSKKSDILYIGSLKKNIDDSQKLTQFIDQNMPWDKQLNAAQNRLRELSSASLVYTTRLHVLLSCIAMGTTVILEGMPVFQSERFSWFRDIIPIGKPIESNSGIREQLIDIWKNNSSKILDSANF